MLAYGDPKKIQRGGGAYSYTYSRDGKDDGKEEPNWKPALWYQADAIEQLLQSKQNEYFYENTDINVRFRLIKMQARFDKSKPEDVFEINFQFIRENGSTGYLRRNGVSDERIKKWTTFY